MSVCWQYDVEISFASINWIQFRQFVLIDRGNSYDPDCRSELFKICNNTFPTIRVIIAVDMYKYPSQVICNTLLHPLMLEPVSCITSFQLIVVSVRWSEPLMG